MKRVVCGEARKENEIREKTHELKRSGEVKVARGFGLFAKVENGHCEPVNNRQCQPLPENARNHVKLHNSHKRKYADIISVIKALPDIKPIKSI